MIRKKQKIYTNRHYFSNDPEFPLSVIIRLPQNKSVLHMHEFTECAFVTAGTGMHSSEEREPVPICQGDILVIPPGGKHMYMESNGLSVINLLFDASHLPSMLIELYSRHAYKELFLRDISHYQNKDFPLFKPPENNFLEMEQYLLRIAQEKNGTETHCYKLGLFMALLSLLCDSKQPEIHDSPVPLAIPKLISYMERNFSRKLYLENLANLAGMSQSSLQRHFRSAFGVTPIAYLQRLRLKHAAEQLVNTNTQIKEIAELTGFPSESFFFRMFKKNYGMSPLAYRNSKGKKLRTIR